MTSSHMPDQLGEFHITEIRRCGRSRFIAEMGERSPDLDLLGLQYQLNSLVKMTVRYFVSDAQETAKIREKFKRH